MEIVHIVLLEINRQYHIIFSGAAPKFLFVVCSQSASNQTMFEIDLFFSFNSIFSHSFIIFI